MVFKIAQGVVTALDQAHLPGLVACQHFTPVQHLVALGDQGQRGGPGWQGLTLQHLQLLHISRLEKDALRRVLPDRVLADVARQIARGVHRRVDQHRRNTQVR